MLWELWFDDLIHRVIELINNDYFKTTMICNDFHTIDYKWIGEKTKKYDENINVIY